MRISLLYRLHGCIPAAVRGQVKVIGEVHIVNLGCQLLLVVYRFGLVVNAVAVGLQFGEVDLV